MLEQIKINSHFCFFVLLFPDFEYFVENPTNLVTNLHQINFRDKREVATSVSPTATSNAPTSVPTQPAPSPTSQTTNDNNNNNSNNNQNEEYKLEGNQRLLGANGTGQRKDVSNLSTTTTIQPTIVADNKQPSNSNKNGGLGATQLHSPEEEYEKVVDSIDESDDAINKTLSEHLNNSTMKRDYFQYYNGKLLIFFFLLKYYLTIHFSC